jgi:hypothetical protein
MNMRGQGSARNLDMRSPFFAEVASESRRCICDARGASICREGAPELSYLGALPAGGVEVAEIPQSGHFPMYSNPLAMRERIAQFHTRLRVQPERPVRRV